MAVPMPGNISQNEIARDATGMPINQEPQSFPRKWYFSKEEIEYHTPSRADGIDYKRETHLQKLYCSFLQELGIELKVPQVTIATAMMLCHRFYMRQSHAKNDWQTISTACMFLACKAEETPRWLGELVVVAYKLVYKWDPSAPRRIREIYDKQKELIVVAERLLLATVAFDLNIEHPYKPLVAALKKLDITHKELVKVAWNFVNDWLCTSLCLQHKPHYVAAGSIFLAAKFQKLKLPTAKGKVWWMEFDVSPKQLEEVIQQMMGLWQQNRKQALPLKDQRVTESKPIISKAMSSSPQSCTLSGSTTAQDSKMVASPDAGRLENPTSTCIQKQAFGNVHESSQETVNCQTSDCGSANSVVEDGDGGEPVTGKSDPSSVCKIGSLEGGNSQVDVNRIREKLKRRSFNRITSSKFTHTMDDEIDGEAWIERELENGIELEPSFPDKRKRI